MNEAIIRECRQEDLPHSMVYSANADYARTARFYERCGYRMWHIFMTQ